MVTLTDVSSCFEEGCLLLLVLMHCSMHRDRLRKDQKISHASCERDELEQAALHYDLGCHCMGTCHDYHGLFEDEHQLSIHKRSEGGLSFRNGQTPRENG